MRDINYYFSVLELTPEASLDEVKEAYRDLVKVWHPDRFAHDPKLQGKAQEKLKEINDAYQKLQEFFDYANSYQETSDTSYNESAAYTEESAGADTNEASDANKEAYSGISQPPPKKSGEKSKRWSCWRWLLWWQLDQTLLDEQLAGYQSLNITK